MNDTTPTRRILRSRSERILGGVAGGLADYLNVDPVLIRLAFVALSLVGGVGALLYLVAWLIVPDAADPGDAPTRTPPDGRTKPMVPVWAGVSLLVLLVLFGGFRHVAFGIDGRALWPFLLIVFGAAVLWSRAGSGRTNPRPGPPPGTPTGPDPAGPPATDPVDPLADARGSASPDDTAPGVGLARRTDPPTDLPTEPIAMAGVSASASTPPQPPPAASTRPSPLRRAAPVLGRIVVALFGTAVVFVLAILLVLLVEGRNALVVTPIEAVFASIAVVAAAVGLGILWHRVPDLLVMAVAAVLVFGFAAWLRPPLRGGFGDREVRPENAGALETSYELAGGRLRLDLSSVHPAVHARTVSAAVAIGQLDIVVPRNVTVRYEGRVSAGAVCVFGHEDAGTDNVVKGDVSSSAPGAVLTIHARVGSGALHLEHPGEEAWRDCNPQTRQNPAPPTVSSAPSVPTVPSAAVLISPSAPSAPSGR